jgi:NAD+ kinase
VSLIEKRSTYRKLVLEAQDLHVARLLRRKDPTVERLKQSHEDHESTIREVRDALAELDVDIVFRGSSRQRIPKRSDVVITVGGDGTLLAASHLVGAGSTLLGINSAPGHSIGFFCGGSKGTARAAIALAIEGKLSRTTLSRMRVELNGRAIHNRVLNEALFCHTSPAATSRYIFELPRGKEEQRSSGVWVGPAAGSTAAQRSAGGNVLPLRSRHLQYVVREPYTPMGGRFRFALGLVGENEQLVLRSKMRDARVFIDGHRLVQTITLGDVLTLRRSDEPLVVLGIADKHRK